MKNKLIIFLILALVAPVALMLVGCGATSVNQAQGVTFLSNIQESGKAVFELDLGSPLVLPYKITPSSARGYAPRFTAVSGISGDNMETFSLNIVTGEFCINRDDFKDVEVEINIAGFKDTCKITLKKYPTAIGVYDETKVHSLDTMPRINLASGTSFQINVYGIFDDSEIVNAETGEKKPTRLLDSHYNFLVQAGGGSNTIINIPNQHRLNLVTYNNYGSATVKVAICDYFGNVIVDELGNAELAFEIKINVYMPCRSMDINISGAKNIISSAGSENIAKISANALIYNKTNQEYIIDYSVDFYDKFERLINDNELSVDCFADKSEYVRVDNNLQKIYLTKPASGGTHDFLLKFWSNAPLENNEYLMAEIIIRVTF